MEKAKLEQKKRDDQAKLERIAKENADRMQADFDRKEKEAQAKKVAEVKKPAEVKAPPVRKINAFEQAMKDKQEKEEREKEEKRKKVLE